jgi:phosphoribosylaminoimidazole-succinocarboxamide synthase
VTATLQTGLTSLGVPRLGKVREVYDLGETVLIVATDRISAFDVIMQNGIPDKGRVLNGMSAFWFDRLNDICPNHVLTTNDAEIAQAVGEPHPELAGRAMLARKTKPLPIECVARGYISGSLYKEYRSQGPSVHGLGLPPGLVDSDRLPEPIFTPATKAEEGHDENISFGRACDLVGSETAHLLRDWTLGIYTAACEHAQNAGLILADTKFEFGETADGIIWIDEALTPDSSRYWDASRYQPGHAQPSFDKQAVRDFLEQSGWNMQPPGPRLPDEVVTAARDKYLEAFRRITGTALSIEP